MNSKNHQSNTSENGLSNQHGEPPIPKGLSAAHFRQLNVESGISRGIIESTGYVTVYAANDLTRLGFSHGQTKTTPGLLVPKHGIDGKLSGYQFRSDNPHDPRRKYVSPPKTRNSLAVSLLSIEQLPNPNVALLFVEGIKKRDSIISHMSDDTLLCVVSVDGVYGWRGTNEHGGKAAIPDFEHVALNDRLVFLAFDSDAMTKKEVYGALSRFKSFLESKGAKVRIIYLPHAEDGSKTGADDYLVAGHTLADMLALASDELRPIEGDGFCKNPRDSVVETELVKRYNNTIIRLSDTESFMQYEAKEHGIWSPVYDDVIQSRVKNDLSEFYPKGFDASKFSGVMRLVKIALSREIPTLPSHLIPYSNGVLDITDMSFHQHKASRFCTWTLGYPYDPKAHCQVCKEWLLEAMEGDEARVEVIRAFMNAVIKRRVDLQVFLELIGPGGTGKGTLIRLLMALIGYDNVKPTELLHLETNRFELSQIKGKKLIVITDEDRYGQGVSNLKKLTGQDILRGEFKGVSTHVDFVAEGLVILAANEAVQSSDYTSGLARRRITVPFRVKPKEPKQLIEFASKKPVGLFAQELPGVTNWALNMDDSEVEYTLRNATETSTSMHTAKMENLVETNPLAAWANEYLIHDTEEEGVKGYIGVARQSEEGNGYEKVDEWLYPNYRRYCEQTGHRAVSMHRFGNLLLDLLCNQLARPGIIKGRDTDGSHIVAVRIRSGPDDGDLLITKLKERSY